MSDREDGFNHPRMKTYMRAEDLNTEGCLMLAEAVLQGASEDYIHARRAVIAHPNNKEAQAHFKAMQEFYRSDYFAALSGGVIDGEDVMRKLNKEAVKGWKVCATAMQ